MSIPMGGVAALLVVATFALTSCGGDDASTSTPSAAAGATAVQTVTQTATATAAATGTTTAPRTSATTKTQSQTTAQKTTTTAAAEPATTAAPQPAAGTCEYVEVGIRDGDVDETFAKITERRGVSCQTTLIVAGEWGRQQLGLDKALLPKAWSCTKQNVCTNGAGRITFKLVKVG